VPTSLFSYILDTYSVAFPKDITISGIIKLKVSYASMVVKGLMAANSTMNESLSGFYGQMMSSIYRVWSWVAVDFTGTNQAGRTRSCAPSFVWHNAKSFYCFSLWEKAALRFQCILKSILHEKTVNELVISHYTLLRACTKQLCIWVCRLTENISKCRLFHHTQVFSIRFWPNFTGTNGIQSHC